MDFSILGPLEVRAGDRAVPLGGVKPRALVAMLALHANRPVSAEHLARGLWGDDAPAGAVKTVQVHVSRLRKALGDPDVLTTTPAGYRLRVRPGELDAERFEALVADGRRELSAGRAEPAGARLREALGLWRGAPLADLADHPFAPAEIARLEEQRLGAVELRVEADLAAGRHAELTAELEQLTREHPWREHLHAQRMLALYRSGRQADALTAYRSARRCSSRSSASNRARSCGNSIRPSSTTTPASTGRARRHWAARRGRAQGALHGGASRRRAPSSPPSSSSRPRSPSGAEPTRRIRCRPRQIRSR